MVGTIASIRWSIARGYQLDAAAIRCADHADPRITAGLKSWTSGCVASQLMIAETSRPSKSGELTSNLPPELHSPRGSQVTTL